MTDNKRNNLDRALGQFIEAMRLFVPLELEKEHGANWSDVYYSCLTDNQKVSWDRSIGQGKSPNELIDFHNLKGLALNQKPWLRKFFGRSTNNLPTEFGKIADARHMFAHYGDWDDDTAEAAFINMIMIAKKISMSELEEEIRNLKEDKSVEEQIAEVQSKKKEVEPALTAWFNNVKPHLDIRQGNLDESVFAADLAEVSLGTGRAVYNNQSLFFDKTYFTEGLTNIADRVIKGLNGNEDGENRVISLQTGFGGGKTHTLISLYHLAKAGKNISQNIKVLDKLKTQPSFDHANIAVFTNTTNDPTQGRTVDGIHIKTIWGEIAYQLGGKELFEKIRPNDEARTAPKGLFFEILQSASPCLILIDELADYCVASSGIKVGGSTLSDQTISFMQEFTEAVAKVKDSVAVITLPASVQEVANSPQAAAILQSLENRVKRVGADTKPVGEEEIIEVIRHRLFEGIGDSVITEGVLQSYSTMYQNLWSELPSRCTKTEYFKMMERSYPFHPELINIFKNKWASNPQFQRTRGVLRLLASVVSDLWKRRNNLNGNHTLIHPSHLQLDNLDSLTGEIKKLYGMGYDAVISSDICGINSNAYQIDQDKPAFKEYALTQGISTAVYLNSFGSEGVNKGVSVKELKLQLIVPEGFNHNSINSSLDELQNKAYYLYYSQTGASEQRFWYHTKPNLNILVNNALSDIKEDRVDSEILNLLQDKAGRISKFKAIVNPSGDIPELKTPSLIILKPSLYHNGNKELENTIKEIALKKGNSDRIYRNTMLFLSLSSNSRSMLVVAFREYLACLKIRDEFQSTLEQDQKVDLKSRIGDASNKIQKELVTAYNQVHKYSSSNGISSTELQQFSESLDRQISNTLYEKLKDDEWLLEMVGHNTLKKNNLLPSDGTPIQTKSVLEAFLRYDDKPMISSKAAVQDSLTKYCYNKQFAIASKSGESWTKMYFGETISMFDVDDETYWLVSTKDYEAWIASQLPSGGSEPVIEPSSPTDLPFPDPQPEESSVTTEKVLKQITISGTANAVAFNQLFSSFIMPLKENDVKIEFTIKAKSKPNYPLTENSQQYKIVKESASQLGFDLEQEKND